MHRSAARRFCKLAGAIVVGGLTLALFAGNQAAAAAVLAVTLVFAVLAIGRPRLAARVLGTSDRILTAHHYRTASVIMVNAAVLFLGANVLAHEWRVLRGAHNPRMAPVSGTAVNPVTNKYGDAAMLDAYPGMTRETIAALLDETWSRPLAYSPYVQFKERPYAGTYVNVDEDGFRRGPHQGPWPPEHDCLNVFVFGGSTTFGYGVPDAETVPAALQDWLSRAPEANGKRVCVYNFGCVLFYSTQERVLFEQLLSKGAIPDVAVFVDGLNDGPAPDELKGRPATTAFSDEPAYTERLREYFDSPLSDEPDTTLKRTLATLARLPLVRAFQRPEPEPEADAQVSTERVRDLSRWSGAHYLSNKKLIEAAAAASRTVPIFVWQPVPYYKHGLAHFPPRVEDVGAEYVRGRYEWMAGHIPQDDGFVWAADVQEGLAERLYVDAVHYNAKMSSVLAKHIADNPALRRTIAQWR